jgi:hypothetical protein
MMGELPVTDPMPTEPQVSEEAVEAACEAHEDDGQGYTTWANLSESIKEECRVEMRRALAAAAPFMGGQLQDRNLLRAIRVLAEEVMRLDGENARLRQELRDFALEAAERKMPTRTGGYW